MKLPRKKRDETSAAITPTLWLMLGCSVLFIVTAYASDPTSWHDPAWWNTSGAVLSPQVTTNGGIVTTNYIANNNAVVTQGQLKQFTARAVDYLNANLTNGGAGTNLNTLVSNWASDYATNGYNATNIKPSDYTVMNVGQLKYIGNQVWSQLVAAGYTNAVPSWLAQNTNSDHAVANLGQLKEVFNFDVPPTAATALVVMQGGSGELDLVWTNTATNATSITIQESSDGGITWTTITTLNPATTSYSATGLTDGNVYSFQIGTSDGISSSSSSASTPQASAPTAVNAPTVCAAGQTDGSMILTWSNNLPTATGFLIENSTNGGTAWSSVATIGSSTNSYTAPATNYPTLSIYHVIAQSPGGSSPPAVPSNKPSYAVIDLGLGYGQFINNAGQCVIADASQVLTTTVFNGAGNYYFWSGGVSSLITKPTVDVTDWGSEEDVPWNISGLNDNGEVVGSIGYEGSGPGIGQGDLTDGEQAFISQEPFTWSLTNNVALIDIVPFVDVSTFLSDWNNLYGSREVCESGLGPWIDSGGNVYANASLSLQYMTAAYEITSNIYSGGTAANTGYYYTGITSPAQNNYHEVAVINRAGTIEVDATLPDGAYLSQYTEPDQLSYSIGGAALPTPGIPVAINDWSAPIVGGYAQGAGDYDGTGRAWMKQSGAWQQRQIYPYTNSVGTTIGNGVEVYPSFFPDPTAPVTMTVTGITSISNQGQMLVSIQSPLVAYPGLSYLAPGYGGSALWQNGQVYSLDALTPATQGAHPQWASIYANAINNSGSIVGSAIPLDQNGNPVVDDNGNPVSHAVLLVPADFAPAVLKVNSSFNEQKINSTTGYAQPDNYDEDLKIASGHTNAGKITVTNLHQNFFGVKPGTVPNSFFAGDTVTIKKLDNTDSETGQTEAGTIRLYAIQNLGQSGEQSYPIPISNSGQTLPHSAVPFTTSISTDQPANLVPVLYSDSATIPQGSAVSYYMEGVDPGPITLEYRIHFGSGSTPDVVVDQHFLVCTQQSKTAWEQDIRQEILLQTGVDMNSYSYTGSISAPFMTDKTYIQTTYAYYQELFTQKSTLFGWAGLAKMAGADVYGAMDDSEYVRGTIPFWMSPVSNVVANGYADFVQNTLIKGNYEIFDDLAWQYRAYQASGIGALRYTSSAGLDVTSTTILPIDLTPWNELYQGDYSSTPTIVQDATLKILQREQQQIAQRSWNIFHASSIPDFVFSTLTASPLPSGASFETVMGSSPDVTVYNDRWSWITNPTQGMWQQWNGYSSAVQVGFAGINLHIYSESYSRFYNWDSSTYPIIW